MSRFKKRSHQAFTLIELLVVIAIIAILAGILFPVYARLKEKAVQTDCSTRIKQLGTAFHLYESDYDGIMCGLYVGKTSADFLFGNRWCDVLMPYVMKVPHANVGGIFRCPSTRNRTWKVAYDANLDRSYGFNYYYLGPGTSGGTNVYFQVDSVYNPSATIRLVDIWDYNRGHGTYWAYPPSNSSSSNIYPPDCHNGVNGVCWVDGHVSMWSRSRIMTRQLQVGNVTVTDPWWTRVGPKP